MVSVNCHRLTCKKDVLNKFRTSFFEKSVISAKAPESENVKTDNSENTADADYDENEDYVDDDFLNM